MAELRVRIFTDPFEVRHYVLSAELGTAQPTGMPGYGMAMDPATINSVRITFTPCDPQQGDRSRTSLEMARLFSAVITLDEWRRLPEGVLICQMPRRSEPSKVAAGRSLRIELE